MGVAPSPSASGSQSLAAVSATARTVIDADATDCGVSPVKGSSVSADAE